MSKKYGFKSLDQMVFEGKQKQMIITFALKIRDLYRDAAKQAPFVYEIPEEIYQANRELSKDGDSDKTLLEIVLHNHIFWVEIEFTNSRFETHDIHTPLKYFVRINSKINLPQGKDLIDLLKRKILKKDQEIIERNDPVIVPSFLQKLPTETFVKRIFSRSDLIKRLSADLNLLSTFFIPVQKIIWLNKISAATFHSLPNQSQEEIQIFLIELSILPSGNRDRTFVHLDSKIFKSKECYTYFPGFSFVEEFELIKQIDKIIPYQTIFVLKLNSYENPYFQVWHGQKKILMNGITVPKYVHTDWMHEKDMHKFVLEGDSISKILKSFSCQIDGTDQYPDLNDVVKKIHNEKNGVQKESILSGSSDNGNGIGRNISDGLLLDYGFLADKLVSYIEARPNQTVGIYNLNTELPLSKVNFLKQEKVRAPVALNKRDVTRLDMYMHVCKELAEHMKDCYTFTFSGDVIYFQKKETCTLSTAEIDKQLESFFILSDGKSCRRK